MSKNRKQARRTGKDTTNNRSNSQNNREIKETSFRHPKGSYKPKLLNFKNALQEEYYHEMLDNDITFGVGPAGTGKTLVSVATAVEELCDKESPIERIVLVRPMVEAGEKMGFLPGDIEEKINPYLLPLYDSLHWFFPPTYVQALIKNKVIEIAPIAFMRGRTLSNAFVIVDEAQNTTKEQIKMLLTRLGDNTKMVATGDISQTDLPRNIESGLKIALKILSDVTGISIIQFHKQDIVRNKIVQSVVEAFEKHEEE